MADFVNVLTAVVWALGIIGAIACPIILFYWLFTCLRRVFGSLGHMSEAIGAVVEQENTALPAQPAPYLAGPTQNEETLLNARCARSEINLTRQLGKRRRLGQATNRWRTLGLLWGKSDLNC